MPPPPLASSPRVAANRGFTFVEIVVVMMLAMTAVLMFSRTVTSVSRQEAINRENAIAANAARSMLETLRNVRLENVYRLYNADGLDDPGGPGTGPGSSFAVDGLDVRRGDPDGMVGELVFPGVEVNAPGDPVDLELRENAVDETFGLPRDLDGNSIIDGADHSADYYILPVEVRLQWTGKTGEREYSVFATLCSYQW